MTLTSEMRTFNVVTYGATEKVSDTLSKCRVRIFYTGMNRNRTYITEEFAKQLISSLPYTPVKGIFDKENVDYGDHGYGNKVGQIYGIVPENPNFAWESHIDEDGVERQYACADVILYTGLYPEAKIICSKSQSMEIHHKGLTGEWKTSDTDGQPYYEFHTGHLVGLQVLGDDIEPCFEGAAFFNLCEEIKKLCPQLKVFSKKEERKQMEKNLFKLQNESLVAKIYDALNKDESECIICNLFTDYALVFDTAESKYFKVFFNVEGDALEISQKEECYMQALSAEEKEAFDSLSEFETMGKVVSKLKENSETIVSLNHKIEELTEQLNNVVVDDSQKVDSTTLDNFSAEIEQYKNDIAKKDAEILRLQNEKEDLMNEQAALAEFKKKKDDEEKTKFINEFIDSLDEEQIAHFTEAKSEYSIEDFKREVCYAAYQKNGKIKQGSNEKMSDLIYKSATRNELTGAIKMLEKHKGGNK